MASPSFDFTAEFRRLGLHGKLETINKMVEEHFHGEGVSPLHLAAGYGDVLVCEYLIEKLKIDVDIRNSEEETPLHAAVKAGQFLVAHYLLKSGANPNSATSTGVTVLHYAATGSKELIDLLISRGADVNAVSKYNATPLHCAACGNEEAVRILLDNGANPNMKNQGGHTPLGYSIAKRSFQCVKLLVEAGADVKTSSGRMSLLQLAASNGENEIIKYLLDSGADPNFFNIEFSPPLEMAGIRLNSEAVEILFPVTDPLPYISEWTIGGVIRHFTDIANSQEEPAKAADTYSQALLLSPENVEFQQAYWKAIVAEFDSTLSLCDLESLGFKTQQR